MAQSAKANRDQVIAGLEKAVANSYALLIKTHNYHWNVVGPNFFGLHSLLETQYKDLFAATDELAERLRALGCPAPGGLKAFADLTSIPDAPDTPKDAQAMVQDLVDSRRKMLEDENKLLSAAEEADDQVTVDMITGRIGQNEKDIWMLRSVLGK